MRALASKLIGPADLVTPNIPEAERLTGLTIATVDDMARAAEKIQRQGPPAVLVKGGHLDSERDHRPAESSGRNRTLRSAPNREPPYPWHRLHARIRHRHRHRAGHGPRGCRGAGAALPASRHRGRAGLRRGPWADQSRRYGEPHDIEPARAGIDHAAPCFPIHSRSASSIRVCHPRPPALKWSTTSAERRIVVDTFGLATGGRPRRTFALANFSGQPSWERSGASSRSESRAVECSFPLIGLPHTDDPIGAVARRPDQDHHREVEEPNCDISILAIVSTVVLDGQGAPANTSPARAMSNPLAARVAARFTGSNSIGTIYVTTLNRYGHVTICATIGLRNYRVARPSEVSLVFRDREGRHDTDTHRHRRKRAGLRSHRGRDPLSGGALPRSTEPR